MKIDRKNFGRLTEGYTMVIGIGVAIAIAGLVAFGVLLALGSLWFSVPLIFVFMGIWIAARQWNELITLRVVAGFIASITQLTSLTAAAGLLGLNKQTFIHSLTKLTTRDVVETVIFPGVDAFAPKGTKRPESLPKALLPDTVKPAATSPRFAIILTWIGLIGTIISLIYHIFGLMHYLGFL
jgi:hypothetical protein